MKMKPNLKALPAIKGFQETTLIDWEGRIASIIFLGGCNFRCGFCHSSSLVLDSSEFSGLSFDNILAFLNKKKGWIDGVVITGGEPTHYEEKLVNLIDEIKEEGFLVKVDTNGANPNLIRKMIKGKTVDYIAMDIKAPLLAESYAKAVGVSVDIDNIILSKDMIISSDIEYEFRTTVVPGIIDRRNILEIASSIASAKKYCLQQFVPRDTLDKGFLKVRPYPKEELDKMATLASEHVHNVIVRG